MGARKEMKYYIRDGIKMGDKIILTDIVLHVLFCKQYSFNERKRTHGIREVESSLQRVSMSNNQLNDESEEQPYYESIDMHPSNVTQFDFTSCSA